MLIQIVEDDRALSDGIRLALREPGLTFVRNTNIRQAKEIFEQESPELLLSVNEQRLLRLLVENHGRILTRETLAERLWGDGDYVDENALSVTVKRLRSKLEDKESHVTYIQTVYGQGYRWKRV